MANTSWLRTLYYHSKGRGPQRHRPHRPPQRLENGRWCVFLDGRPVDFHPYHGRSACLQELERLITDPSHLYKAEPRDVVALH